METENLSIENEVVESQVVEPVEVSTEVAEPVVTEPKLTGKEAVEAAFDKVVADSDKKEETKKPEATADGEAKIEEAKGLDPTGKGPNSWKPTTREKFRQLPPDVQQEVLRRENEHQKLMNETTEVRRFATEFMRVSQPYSAFLKANNVNPVAAYADLMNTAYQLKTGDQRVKAQLISQIIKNNNVDISLLDDALTDTLAPVDPVQKELQELRQKIAHQEQQAQSSVVHEVDRTIEQFANDPANEFFGDVVGEMQILLQSGHAKDLKDAYDKACYMNTEIRQVIQGRAQAAPTVATPNIQQKISASSSVKGAPAGNRPAVPKPKLTGKEAAMAAWDNLEKKIRT